MRNKKAIAMSFNWIFAIVVGGFILVLSLYAASQFIRTSEQTVYTETAASIVSLFDPLETGLASGKSSSISFKKESKLYFDCFDNRNLPFGEQTIRFSEKTFGDEFAEGGNRISIKDKYVFSEDIVEGKTMYYFSKPYFAGYKVADLMMIYSDQKTYCVHGAGEDFVDDVEGLNLKNIIFPNASLECEGINVCFKSIGDKCDVRVVENGNYVLKGSDKLYYVDDLLFAAIFSSSDNYECNVKRIKNRFNELAGIYLNKIEVIKRKNCEPTLGPKLLELLAFRVESSRDLLLFHDKIEEINQINNRAKDGCRVYYNVNWKR